jgi:unsaturated rhamnogalacturonyl hydrolase
MPADARTLSAARGELAPEVVALADATVGRRRPSRLGWSWGEGLLLYALLRLDEHLGKPRHRTFVEAYFERHRARALAPVTWSDECPPGLAALELYRVTRQEQYLAFAERVAHYLRTARRTKDGGLNHFGVCLWSRFYPESMWVDSLMMYGVFAARFGRELNDAALLRFAAEQPARFARVLRDPSTGLFRHAWWVDWQRALPAGAGTWLRGNGWALASLVELLDVLPPAHAEREGLLALLRDLASAVVRHQLPSGLFPTVLGRPSYEETSGSALCAYALLRGRAAEYLGPALEAPAARVYRALLERLEQRRHGMSMRQISTATMPYPAWGYALIPQVRDAPHGVAAMILAGIAASRASTAPSAARTPGSGARERGC